MTQNRHPQLYQSLLTTARAAGVFRDVRIEEDRLACEANRVAPEAEAVYFALLSDTAEDSVIVGLQTIDRWLSGSIEADLVHTGDDIQDLLEEELIAQGLDLSLPVEHFRDDAKRYTFLSRLPLTDALESSATVDRITRTLLAYEACFRELGDMAGEEED